MSAPRKNVTERLETCVGKYQQNNTGMCSEITSGMYSEINVEIAAPGCPVERSSTMVRGLTPEARSLPPNAGSPKPEAGSRTP
jgi:hypothetical protein